MRQRVLTNLEKAIETDPFNYLALRYLADHYFFKQEYGVALGLCDRVLALTNHLKKGDGQGGFRKDIDLLRSDVYFIKGKVEH